MDRINFDQMRDNLVNFTNTYLPKALGALLVLLIGFILALIIAKIVRAILRRTSLDNRLAKTISGNASAGESPKLESSIAQIVFYLALLPAVVAFLRILGIPGIAEPLNRFTNRVFDYIPNIIGAVALIFIAFLIARIVKEVALRSLQIFGLDEKVKSKSEHITDVVKDKARDSKLVEDDEEASKKAEMVNEKVQSFSIATSVATTLYYLVFILFLPAILGALNLNGLLDPVQGMANRILGFIPNILGAAVILFVGYFGAKILRAITTNFLRAVGLDALGQRVGLSNILGGQSLSSLVGILVYALVFIPIVVSALNALQFDAITRPALDMLNRIISALPGIFGASLLLLIAFVVGKVVAEIISNVLANIGFDNILQRIGLTQAHATVESSSVTPSKIVGNLVLVYIMVFASIEALGLLQFGLLATLLTRFTALTGNVLIGLVVFAVGLFLANFAYKTINSSNMNSANILAPTARIAIIVLSGAMALGQMGLASNVVNIAFAITLGAIGIAAAIAFGIGGRDVAKSLLEDLANSVKNKR